MTEPNEITPGGLLKRIGEFALITVMLLVAFAVVGGCMTAISGSPFYGGMLSAVCIALLVWVFLTLRRNRENRVLLHVESAVRLNVPVPGYLRTAMAAEPRKVGRAIGDMVELLEHGLPIADALDEVVPDLSVRERRLIQMGQRTNQLPAILRRVVHDRTARPQFSASGMGMLHWYLPLVLTIFVVVTSMLLIFVYPKFEHILRDFGVTSLDRFQWAYRAPRLLVTEFWWVPLIAIAVAFLLSGIREVRRVFRPRRMPMPLTSRLPVVSRIGMSRALSDICWTISMDTRSGIPLPQTVSDLAEMPLEGNLPRKVRTWRDLLVAGQSPADSARAAELPGLLVCMLRTPGEGLSDSLEALARHYDGKYTRMMAILDAMAVPVATLCCAMLVLTVALGIFGPMLQMISVLQETGAHR